MGRGVMVGCKAGHVLIKGCADKGVGWVGGETGRAAMVRGAMGRGCEGQGVRWAGSAVGRGAMSKGCDR